MPSLSIGNLARTFTGQVPDLDPVLLTCSSIIRQWRPPNSLRTAFLSKRIVLRHDTVAYLETYLRCLLVQSTEVSTMIRSISKQKDYMRMSTFNPGEKAEDSLVAVQTRSTVTFSGHWIWELTSSRYFD